MAEKARYTIRAADPQRRGYTGSADELDAALTAAWALQRHLEGPVQILDNTGRPTVVAVVNVEWVDH